MNTQEKTDKIFYDLKTIEGHEDLVALDITFHPFLAKPYTIRFFCSYGDSFCIYLWYLDTETQQMKKVVFDNDFVQKHKLEPEDIVVILKTGCYTIEQIIQKLEQLGEIK